jgi:prepilin-type N-terminal cleavage/methylation domain-containing protein/prepilin-type processing-associated H-X9-DG protein
MSKTRSHKCWINVGHRAEVCRLAFTLVELLVTIAVIGILASLILPAVSRVKGRALQTVCIGNFKQLTAAWRMYSDDNHGKLPAVAFKFRSTGIVNSNAWVRGSMDDDQITYPPITPGVLDSTNVDGIKLGSLYYYTTATAIYHCALDKSSIGGVLRVRSYSINGWMGGLPVQGQSNYVVFKRESDIIKPGPSAAWVFIDEHERSINDGWFAVDMVGSWGLLDVPANRHGGSFALSFADGHVEVWKLVDPRTKDFTARPISNSPLNPDWERLQAASSSLIE